MIAEDDLSQVLIACGCYEFVVGAFVDVSVGVMVEALAVGDEMVVYDVEFDEEGT